jgi:excisionase family DNA binding protein
VAISAFWDSLRFSVLQLRFICGSLRSTQPYTHGVGGINSPRGFSLDLTRDPEPALLTIEEAARYLRLSRAKVYAMAQRGDMPSVRMGRSVRIRRERLDAWLDEQSTR